MPGLCIPELKVRPLLRALHRRSEIYSASPPRFIAATHAAYLPRQVVRVEAAKAEYRTTFAICLILRPPLVIDLLQNNSLHCFALG